MANKAIDYRKKTRQIASEVGIDPNQFERQIGSESGFDPNAGSPAGARGIAQIMPATAKGWHVNPNDPVAALYAAARAMKKYQQQFGAEGALVAYNAGPGMVGSKHLPTETKNYIAKIMGTSPIAASQGSPQEMSLGDSGGYSPPTTRADKASQLSKIFATMAPQAPSQPDALSSFTGLPSMETDSRKTYDLLNLLHTSHASKTPAATATSPIAPRSTGQNADGGKFGIATFDGKHVPDWALDDLAYARKHGWKGTVTSGVRTREEQQYLYTHPQGYPVAKPGTSNHEIENGGAIDASDAQQLWEILKNKPNRKLTWAPSVGLDDEVHFSLTGH